MVRPLIKRLFGRPQAVVHCIGDSHAEVFKLIQAAKTFPNVEFKSCIVPGASNMGLANPRSTTNAGTVFREYIAQSVRPADHAIFCLGEVDCGFVIWYRAEKLKMTVQEQFDTSMENYWELISAASSACSQVIVMSVPPPTIHDGQDWGSVAHERRAVTASIRDRSDLTMEYNHVLRKYCESTGVVFLDLQPVTFDEKTQLVRPELRNPDPLDHHLNPTAFAQLISGALKDLPIFAK